MVYIQLYIEGVNIGRSNSMKLTFADYIKQNFVTKIVLGKTLHIVCVCMYVHVYVL